MIDYIEKSVNPDDTPTRIVCMLKLKNENFRWGSYFIGDNNKVYLTNMYSLFLGLSRKQLIHRICTMGYDHPEILERAGVRKKKPKKNSKPVRDKPRVHKKTLITEKPNGEFDSLIECPPAATGSYSNQQTVGIPDIVQPNKFAVKKSLDTLAVFISNMERKGFASPAGKYNSFSGGMI